ncbi:MAG TPA: hypothetical protein VK508_10265 [Cyclobacteriaceae bacterium]|nr:hypothetical protein [Cyclobacteriaceae bacterium]
MKKLVLMIGIIVAALTVTTLRAEILDPGKGDRKAKKELRKEDKEKLREHKDKQKEHKEMHKENKSKNKGV